VDPDEGPGQVPFRRKGGTGPAFLESPGGIREPVFIVDEMKDGAYAVLVPLAPTPTIGSIRIVPGDRLTRMEAGLGEVANSIMQWGLDAGEVMKAPFPDDRSRS
jgi:uncharacterized membrane protein